VPDRLISDVMAPDSSRRNSTRDSMETGSAARTGKENIAVRGIQDPDVTPFVKGHEFVCSRRLLSSPTVAN